LSIVKSGSAGPVRSGDVVTYTLTYRNAGPSLSSSVVVSDTLPPGSTFVSAAPVPTTNNGSGLTWNVGDLDPNASGTIIVSARLVGAAGQVSTTRTNTAYVDSPLIDDPTPGDNTDTHELEVLQPDLRVVKDDGLTEVQPGDVVTYTITVENVGRAEARGVILTEYAPVEALVLSADWNDQGDGVWAQVVGTLAPGARRTVPFVVRVPVPYLAPTLRNVVRTTDDGSTGTPITPSDDEDDDEDQVISGTVGDRIWFDTDEDGVQDPGEVGVEGGLVQLLDPNTLDVIAETVSGPDGAYQFTGLRMGDYAVQIAPSALQSGPYAGYRITSDPLPTTALTPAERIDLRLDIGIFNPESTDVTMASMGARFTALTTVQLRWQTVAESNNAGFRILRGITPDVNETEQLGYVRSQGSAGGVYTFTDPLVPTERVYYWIVAVEFDGTTDTYGPIIPVPLTVQNSTMIYIPMAFR
jgi:uncharacterized repeat protein (TIGR01451 family)